MTDQKTLLIIDDEIGITESLSLYFEDDGYRVFTASDGGEGLKIFFKEDIDVVLTDLRMPVKDGIEVMTEIHEAKPDTPMLVFSGAGEKKDIIRALRMGAKDYITKPIEDLEMIGHAVGQAFSNKKLQEENLKYREELEKSEHQYRTITENIAEGVFTVDEAENFTYTNQAFCSMTGYSQEKLLKTNLKDIIVQKSLASLQAQTLAHKNGLKGKFEIQLMSKDSHSVHVQLSNTPVFSIDDQYKGFIAVAHDITELHNLRDKFHKFLTKKNTSSEDVKNVLPICASCKSIKNKEEDWVAVENHFSNIVFSHGICPDCCKKLYPQFDLSELDPKKP